MKAEPHVPVEVEIRSRLLAAMVRADLAAYGDYRAQISDLCPVRPTSGPRVFPLLRIAGGETDTDPEPASADGSVPTADPPAPTPSEGSGAPESQPHDEPTTPEPAPEPAYIAALREDIAWLKSQFGSSDVRVKALEGRMEQAMKGRKAQRPAAPTTVRTRMTVQEPPEGQEVTPPPERQRRTKRLKWGRKAS